MDDEQLRRLISSLSILSNHGSFPLHTFSVLASAAPPDKLAEQLHQRWLSEESFATIAAVAVLHVHHLGEISDSALWSCCLAHLLSDYRSRYNLRKKNPLLFRNNVRTLLKMYPVFREIDAVVSESLIKPIFMSLNMLMDEEADDKDVQVYPFPLAMVSLVLEDGSLLHKLRPNECDKLVLMARHCLCEKTLNAESRRGLLNIIDLWTYGWDMEMFPDYVMKFYEGSETKENVETAKRKVNNVASETKIQEQLQNEDVRSHHSYDTIDWDHESVV
ncbi:unnamed protein product [Anisakis simplex]|uniref:CID domain-containing protein n=1 Tax=Anisakis simplex TaxID=6269 RepID=A0A0M3K989_ANISI|nr:unnamed protein product [Anisakis simplex]